jgi:hypothetical protein
VRGGAVGAVDLRILVNTVVINQVWSQWELSDGWHIYQLPKKTDPMLFRGFCYCCFCSFPFVFVVVSAVNVLAVVTIIIIIIIIIIITTYL